jgi:hypothetical protein
MSNLAARLLIALHIGFATRVMYPQQGDTPQLAALPHPPTTLRTGSAVRVTRGGSTVLVERAENDRGGDMSPAAEAEARRERRRGDWVVDLASRRVVRRPIEHARAGARVLE